MKFRWRIAALAAALTASAAWGQSTGSIRGLVRLKETGDPLHGAIVVIGELDRSVVADADGRYRFDGVPAGQYRLTAHLGSITTEASQAVEVRAGKTAKADFALELEILKHEITVTASGKPETAFESFQSVDSLDSFDLAENSSVSLGEALGRRVGSGVAKRSFGPGSARPIVRGFDGDRVLIMQDGVRTGTLSAQSGDHGELINTAQVDQVEIVKGPATLLYGGSAMGGTINAVSRHHSIHQHAHPGLRGFLSGSAGAGNALGAGNGGFEYGSGSWMLWGSAGGSRTSDYSTPRGKVFNSRTRSSNGRGGLGYYGPKQFFSFEFQADDGFYGIPFANLIGGVEEDEEEGKLERVSIDARRYGYHANWGLKNVGSAIENFVVKLSFTDWRHDEVGFFESGASEIGTSFSNRQFIYRAQFEQAPKGRLSGRFGVWGMVRDYDVAGEEALSPNIDQDAFAAFALEEIEFERLRFQFGARLEWNRYTPVSAERANVALPGLEPGEARRRSYTGASASVGVRAELWKGGAFLANYFHTFRAPALEELYNFGPHPGNVSFEVGDPNLGSEQGDGFDLSLRHETKRARGSLNFFYYGFSGFIFPFFTGRVEEGLRVLRFTQLDARFVGSEATLDLALHPSLWLNLGADYVNAKETEFNTPLPRIPPLRAKIGLDFHARNLSVKPELILANQQQLTFPGETRTPGNAVWNLKATYSIPRRHVAHQIAFELFNIGDRLYFNHSSFIKDLAPEIGRGVRLTYVMRFF